MATTQQIRSDKLKTILVQKDHDSFTEFVLGMSENERLELGETARELCHNAFFVKDVSFDLVTTPLYQQCFEEILHALRDMDSFPPDTFQKSLVNQAKNQAQAQAFHTYQTKTLCAAFAFCSFEELKNLGLSLHHPQTFKILLDRSPPWLGEYICFLNKSNKISAGAYCELGLKGIFELPRNSQITKLIMNSIHGYDCAGQEKRKLREYALECPRILNEEIWNFFELPVSDLYAADYSYSGAERWDETIISLGKKDVLDRKRLLELSFEKIKQSVDTPCVAWPCKVHKGLGNKPKEITKYADSYFNWLGHENEALDKFAAEMMLIVCVENAKYDERILDRLDTSLPEMTKDRAKKTLHLFAAILERTETLREKILDLVFSGLEHEATDIQAAALKLLTKQPEFQSAEMTERLQRFAPLLAASVRAMIPKELLEQAVNEPSESKEAVSFRKPNPITPIRTLEEFIDSAVHLLETAESMDEAERLLDFMARTTPDRNEEFQRKTSALAKRAVQTFSKKSLDIRFHISPDFTKKYPNIIALDGRLPFGVDGLYPQAETPLNDLGSTILVWIFGKMPERFDVGEIPRKITLFRVGEFILGGRIYHANEPRLTPGGFFRIRTEKIAQRIAKGESHPLLSTPTHQHGWIDPRTFVERLGDYLKEPKNYDRSDQVLALTRLSSEHRSEALAALSKSDDEYIEAVRYALGADGVKIGLTPGYWISAARSRNPLGNDVKVESAHPGWGPDATTAASYRFASGQGSYDRTLTKIDSIAEPHATPQTTHIDMPTVLVHFESPLNFEAAKLGIDWGASVWPSVLEPVLAHPVPWLCESIDKPGNLMASQLFFPLLSRLGLRFGDNAHLMIAIGLCHRNQEVYLPTTDILISAINEDRLDSGNLVRAIRILFHAGLGRPPRMAKRLADIAKESADHSSCVRKMLENILVENLSSETNPLLELLLELCIEAGKSVESGELRENLAGIKGSGKAAKLAKKLLEL